MAGTKMSPDARSKAREVLTGHPDEKLAAVAKKFDVQVGKYKKLAPGLRRMNTINSIIGAMSRAIQGGAGQTKVLASIK